MIVNTVSSPFVSAWCTDRRFSNRFKSAERPAYRLYPMANAGSFTDARLIPEISLPGGEWSIVLVEGQFSTPFFPRVGVKGPFDIVLAVDPCVDNGGFFAAKKWIG